MVKISLLLQAGADSTAFMAGHLIDAALDERVGVTSLVADARISRCQ